MNPGARFSLFYNGNPVYFRAFGGLPPPPVPVAPEFDYFFEFSSRTAAFADSVVGPLLSLGNFVRTNIWSFDLAQNLPIDQPQTQQPPFYWCMVARPAQSLTFLAHPNLKFVLLLPGIVLLQNMGNSGFVAISIGINQGISLGTNRALYAKNWSFGLTGTEMFGNMVVDSSGNALTDSSGINAMVTFIS